MLTWEQLKKAKLGEVFEIHDLNHCCRRIYGAIGWPGGRPGFAVVLAMNWGRDNATGSHEVCLLDEFESFSYHEIIRHCGMLNSRYEPDMWLGDTTNDSAEELMWEMRKRVDFHVSETDLIEMKPMYPYFLSKLKELRDEKHRRLFLHNDSKLLKYMGEIEQGQDANLELGDYPAIEVLGYAVIELLRVVESAGHIPSFVGEYDPRGWRPKTIADLAYVDAVDDLDPDDEDDDDWCQT